MPNSFETVELSAAATQEQVLAQVTEVMQELRDATASSPLLGLGAPVAEQSETLIEAHRTRFGQDVLDLTGNPALPELLDELSRLDACFPATHDADEALNLHEQDLINQIAETEAELQRRAWLVLPDLKTTGSAHVEEEDEGMLHDDDASLITQADPSHHPENSSGELKSEASQASMPREVSLAVLAATAAQIQLNRHLTENLVMEHDLLASIDLMLDEQSQVRKVTDLERGRAHRSIRIRFQADKLRALRRQCDFWQQCASALEPMSTSTMLHVKNAQRHLQQYPHIVQAVLRESAIMGMVRL